MPDREKSYVSARYLKDGTPWMPVAPGLRYVDMAREDGPTVRFKLSSILVSMATGKTGSDKWRCSLSAVCENQAHASTPYEFDYSMGTVHRTSLRGGPKDGVGVPTEPTCKSVLVSLGMDVSFATEMPLDLKRAAAYVQAELGYDRVDEAIDVTEKLRDAADGIRSMLAHVRATSEDFAAFGRELEAMPEPFPLDRDGFDIRLPVAVKEGEEFKAVVRVEFGAATRAAIDIDGNPVEPGMRRLSMTASVMSRLAGKGRWESRSMGQSVDLVREIWSDDPVAVELCDVWDRWHLNDMKAGTRAQVEAIKDFRLAGGAADHEASVNHLRDLGLDTDASVLVKGKPYAYGTAWLVEPLPAEVEYNLYRIYAHFSDDLTVPEPPAPRI
jgi:hypothetical protein